MSSFDTTIYTTLTGYAGLTSLVGTRVYPEYVILGATYPLVVYMRVSTTRAQSFGSGQAIVTSRPRYQFDAWAETAVAAADVSEQVRNALLASGYAVTIENEMVLHDPETRLHRRTLDAFVAHTGA